MKLNYKTYGKGKPVFILHGLFGMLDNWQIIAKQLAKHFEIIVPDLRNHGRSPHSDDFDYEYMSSDILGLIHDLGYDEVNVIGHSMGGKLAIRIAIDNPNLVEKLMVLDIGIKKYPPNHVFLLDILSNIYIEKYSDRMEIEHELKTMIEDYRLRQFIMKNISRNENGKFNWKMNLNVIKENYKVITDEILLIEPYMKETLFVRGDKSNYILDKDLELISKQFPNSKLITIPNAGHWLHADQADKLLEVIRSYI